MTPLTRRSVLAAVPLALLAACDKTPAPEATPVEAPAPLGPMIEPAELAARLTDVKAGRIAVLYVGPGILFEEGHVPGAKQLPEAGTDEGYAALVKAIAATPKDTEIIVYCGCCPYRNCQNVRPASKAIRASGRKNARYLDVPTNFRTDWIKKGYPVERT